MPLRDIATGNHHFARNLRRTAGGDIEVYAGGYWRNLAEAIYTQRGVGMSGMGSWWQDLIGAGINAGMSTWAASQQANAQNAQVQQQAVARFWEVYHPTFRGLQGIIDALEAGQVPANEIRNAVPMAQQIMAQWSQLTSQLAAIAGNASVAVGVPMNAFIAECNTALAVKMNKIRSLAQNAPVGQVVTNGNGNQPVQIVSAGGGFAEIFNAEIFGIPAWALVAGALILFRSK